MFFDSLSLVFLNASFLLVMGFFINVKTLQVEMMERKYVG